jgi:hypothetical protein
MEKMLRRKSNGRRVMACSDEDVRSYEEPGISQNDTKGSHGNAIH